VPDPTSKTVPNLRNRTAHKIVVDPGKSNWWTDPPRSDSAADWFDWTQLCVGQTGMQKTMIAAIFNVDSSNYAKFLRGELFYTHQLTDFRERWSHFKHIGSIAAPNFLMNKKTLTTALLDVYLYVQHMEPVDTDTTSINRNYLAERETAFRYQKLWAEGVLGVTMGTFDDHAFADFFDMGVELTDMGGEFWKMVLEERWSYGKMHDVIWAECRDPEHRTRTGAQNFGAQDPTKDPFLTRLENERRPVRDITMQDLFDTIDGDAPVV